MPPDLFSFLFISWIIRIEALGMFPRTILPIFIACGRKKVAERRSKPRQSKAIMFKHEERNI